MQKRKTRKISVCAEGDEENSEKQRKNRGGRNDLSTICTCVILCCNPINEKIVIFHHFWWFSSFVCTTNKQRFSALFLFVCLKDSSSSWQRLFVCLSAMQIAWCRVELNVEGGKLCDISWGIFPHGNQHREGERLMGDGQWWQSIVRMKIHEKKTTRGKNSNGKSSERWSAEN